MARNEEQLERVATFLWLLLAEHLTVNNVESLIETVNEMEGQDVGYSTHLKRYSRELADLLLGEE